jgi:hypothetical protein
MCVRGRVPCFQALKNLGLNICRAEVSADDNPNKFYVTDANTSEKVVKSEQIEQIRTVIIQNMIKYHPEAAEVGLHSLRSFPTTVI